MIRIRTRAVVCGAVLAICATADAAPLTVTLREQVGATWQNERVHVALDLPEKVMFDADAVTVAPVGGATIPCQTSDITRHADGSIAACKVWFDVALPAGATAAFTVTPGKKGARANGDLRVETNGTQVTLTTVTPAGRVGIRLPLVDETYVVPVAAAEAPGPVQALLLPSGRETGRGRFEVPFAVKSVHSTVTAAGPLFAEVRVHTVFDVGFWTFTARVEAGKPTVFISEEFDTGYSGQQMSTSMRRHQTNWQPVDRFYSLVLGSEQSDGLRPTQVFYGSNNNDPAYMDVLARTIPPGFSEIRNNWFAAPVHGFTLNWDKADTPFFLLGYASVMPRVGRIARVVEPGGEAVGLIGLHSDRWHNPMSLHLRVTPERELVLSLPLQTYEQEWRSDGFGRFSPNYTGKMLFHPPYLAKRSYGIVLGKDENEAESLLQGLFAIGASQAPSLDEVKEMVLEWPDPLGDSGAAATSPEGQEMLSQLRRHVAIVRAAGDLARFSMAYHHGFGQGGYKKMQEVMADAATELTLADRREARRLLAFLAYDMHAPRRFPYGSGFHHNNPNMTIMAVDARMKTLNLIKGHPMAAQWGAESLYLAQAFIRRFTRPSGAPYENPHYILGVTLSQLATANEVMLEQGVGDAFDSDLFRRMIRFLPHWLTPPDPRFLGHRLTLPLGNCSYQSVPPEMGERLVRYLAPRHPELAAETEWLINQTLPEKEHLTLVDESVPQLGSVHYQDYGVSFRHGFGTPYETLFHMMAGNCFGHYELETDQMAYTLYAKGQPINLHFGNGYFPIFNRPWLRNRVTIDHKWEIPERHEPRIEAVALAEGSDYVHAMKPIDQIQGRTEYPPARGETDPHALTPEPVEDIPLTEWRRQVLFLKDPDPKGPNYFVLRDSFTGTPTRPTDLTLWFLSNEMTRENEVYHFDGQCEVDMDLFVATPLTAEPQTGRYSHVQQPYGRRVGFDPKYHPGGKLGETQQFVRFRQAPGQGYLVVLYPRLKEGDPAATFTRLSETAVRIQTPVSSDTVFLSTFPVTYREEGLSFTGCAASLRDHTDGRREVQNHEGALSLTRDGVTLAGSGPFTVTLRDGKPLGALPQGVTLTIGE